MLFFLYIKSYCTWNVNSKNNTINFKVVLYPLNILNSSKYVKNIHVIEIREDYFNYNINYVYKIEKKNNFIQKYIF